MIKGKVALRIELAACWKAVVLFLALGTLITGCRPSTGTPATPISFMIFGDPAERRAYLSLVEAFEAAHPAIEVQVTHIPSPIDYRTRLTTEFAAGTPPDVTLMNYRRIASFAAADLLTPVDPYLGESTVIDREDFYPVALEAFLWRGELMCLPQNISSLVVYYNQDLFAAAGWPVPADDWHWDQFLDAAVALTQDTDGDGRIDQYGLGLEPTLLRLTPFVWQNGGPIVDDLGRPSRLTLTRYPSQQALDWFVALRQVHGVVPDRVAEASLDSKSRFVAGTTAMYLDSRRATPTFREIERFTWDVAPLPRGQEAAGILHSDAYCLSAAADNKDAAWTFIEYANSVAGQTLVAASGRTVPSLIEVAESDVFLEPDQPPQRSYVWIDTIPFLRRVPVMSHWEEVEKTASEEIERAFYGDISSLEAAQQANWRTEEYFFLSQFAIEP